MSILNRFLSLPIFSRELKLTRQGLVGGLISSANDFGLHSRVLDTAAGTAEQHINTYFGRVIGTAGGDGPARYFHPVFEAGAKETRNAVVDSVDDAVKGWERYYSDPANKGAMSSIGRRAFETFGEGGKKFYARVGGYSNLIAPAITLNAAFRSAREGYHEGGVLGGLVGGVKGVGEGIVHNKIMGYALRHPILGATSAALMYGAYKFTYGMFDVRTRGSNYLKMGRTTGLSWANGGTPGMDSQMASTIRGRALMSMENSRFNAMKTLGSESYMMNTPRARYANSTAIHNTAPMLSY
jgi:hypothetical protein